MEQSAQSDSASQTSPVAFSGAARPAPRVARLGEELPVFCERCGYSLHGLPQTRCECCDVLHFRCPECGHSQPINTLRPAFQRILGRMRAWVLGLWVLIKINYFLWLLIAWVAMGHEWSYQYHWVANVAVAVPVPASPNAGAVNPPRPSPRMPSLRPYPLRADYVLAFMLFAIPFAMVSRMLLLRWRRGPLVGMVLAALVVLAIIGGAFLRQYEWNGRLNMQLGSAEEVPSPLSSEFITILVITAACIVGAAGIAWPFWTLMVRLFLPSRVASTLLEWQASLCTKSLSDKVSSLGR